MSDSSAGSERLNMMGNNAKAPETEGALFIVGAGFTRAIIETAPLNRDLLAAVVKQHAPTLRRYAEQYKERDIEKLLTLIDLNCASAAGNADKEQEAALEDRYRINAEIANYFSSYRIARLQSDLPEAALTFATSVLRLRDSIVSLNYDCLLDGLLDQAGVWTPNGGYGRITNVLGNDPVPPNPLGITIFKIHGSENFVESRVWRKDELRQTVLGFSIEESIYPKSAKHVYIGGGMYEPQQYIIAPSFVKMPHVDIAALMIDLEEHVTKCRHLVVIGCSLRREDSFLWLLLTRFLNRQSSRPLSLTIVDPHPQPIMDRIRSFWVGDVEKAARVSLIENSWVNAVGELTSALAAARES